MGLGRRPKKVRFLVKQALYASSCVLALSTLSITLLIANRFVTSRKMSLVSFLGLNNWLSGGAPSIIFIAPDRSTSGNFKICLVEIVQAACEKAIVHHHRLMLCAY